MDSAKPATVEHDRRGIWLNLQILDAQHDYQMVADRITLLDRGIQPETRSVDEDSATLMSLRRQTLETISGLR